MQGRSRFTSGHWRSARRRWEPSIPIRRKPQQPRGLALIPGRLCGCEAALRAGAGDLREGAGAEHPETGKASTTLRACFRLRATTRGRSRFTSGRWRSREGAGAEHPDTSTSLNNLASCFNLRATIAGARPLYERALAIPDKALGAEHPDTATSLNNLAGLLRDSGRCCGSTAASKARVAIFEKALGPDHPNTNRGALQSCAAAHGRRQCRRGIVIKRSRSRCARKGARSQSPLDQATLRA